MKITKLYLAIVFVIFLGTHVTVAQKYELNVSESKQLVIDNILGAVEMEGYDGTNLIILAENIDNKKKDSRAEGLKPIYASGVTDNTKIGLEVTIDGEIVTIREASKEAQKANYHIKIPRNLNVKIDCQSPFAKNDIKVNNISGEIEVKALIPDITMSEVTGPVIIDMINGNIEIDFSTLDQEHPVSISAINGDVDLTLPANTPANVELGTINGEIFSNFDIDFERKEKEGLNFIGGGQDINGTINGGGVKLSVKTITSNVYLRKK